MNVLKLDNTKILALFKLIAVFALVFNPWAKFPYRFIFIIITILTITYFEDKSFKKIGFKNQFGFLKLIGITLMIFVIIEPVLDFIIQPLVNKLTGEVPDYTAFDLVKNDFPKFIKYLLFIWISAAFGEELLFRGFMFKQFNTILPEFRLKTITIILISSFLFATPHLYLGISGVILTFIFGLLFSFVYVKYDYNLWIAILLHGLVDSLFITLSYFDKLEYYEISNKLLFGY